MQEKEGNNKLIIILMIVLILAIVFFMIFNIVLGNKKENNVINTANNIVSDENNTNPNLTTDLEQLSKMQEFDRIKYYINKYLFYIENQDYERAYSLLYEDFKNEYFKTIEEFAQYVSGKYPIVNTITYEGYDKLGKYHVLTIEFSDVLSATEDDVPTFKQKFIVVENGVVGDFRLSFQAE